MDSNGEPLRSLHLLIAGVGRLEGQIGEIKDHLIRHTDANRRDFELVHARIDTSAGQIDDLESRADVANGHGRATRWREPAVVGVLAAAIGGLVSAAVAWWLGVGGVLS